VTRLGTPRVVATGLAGVAVILALAALLDAGTSALALIAWFFGLSLSMGWVMAPATAAVVGAVPVARSGVASATNTVARMVSGALGVAVIGSLASSLYGDDMERAGAPEPAAESVGGASAVAAQLPPDAGAGLLATAGEAFSDAMGAGLLLAAALAALAAVLVARLLPRSRN
jgi:DHA2 family multidrug resistance protein-like MFS transporter